MQYRMNLEVLAFPNLHFYDNTLMAYPMIAHRKLDDQLPGVIFIDTAGTGFEECRDETTRSIYNPGEVDIVIKHIMQRNELLKDKELAIISPYVWSNDQRPKETAHVITRRTRTRVRK